MIALSPIALAWALLDPLFTVGLCVVLVFAYLGDGWGAALTVLWLAAVVWVTVSSLHLWALRRRDPLWQQHREVRRLSAAIVEAYALEIREIDRGSEEGIARAVRRQRQLSVQLYDAEHGLAMLTRHRSRRVVRTAHLHLVGGA